MKQIQTKFHKASTCSLSSFHSQYTPNLESQPFAVFTLAHDTTAVAQTSSKFGSLVLQHIASCIHDEDNSDNMK